MVSENESAPMAFTRQGEGRGVRAGGATLRGVDRAGGATLRYVDTAVGLSAARRKDSRVSIICLLVYLYAFEFELRSSRVTRLRKAWCLVF